MPPSPRLLGVSGPLKNASFPLPEAEFCIGRDPENHLCLPDPAVSRRQCALRKLANGFELRDLGSRTQTTVNGSPIVVALLQHGDRIAVGESVFLFLEMESEPSAASAAVEFSDEELRSASSVQIAAGQVPPLSADSALAAVPPSDQLARDLAILLQIATRVGSIHSVEALQWQLLGMLFEVVPADRGAILLVNGSTEELAAAIGWDRLAGPSQTVRVSRSLLRRVLRERVPTLVHNAATPAPSQGSPAPPQSLLCVPVAVSEQVLGAIYLDTVRPANGFTDHHLQLTAAIAGIAALAFENARQMERLRTENRWLRSEISLEHDMVGDSPRMQDVYQTIARLASTESTILICGESGTGKELAARAIHRNSPRAGKPFVAINCAALPEHLLESELFGYEKGAFTGAAALKLGQLEVADTGTLFLDEIGELAPALQAKLLRVLQEREFFRLGGTRPIRVNLRLIAATNKDLESAVAAGQFRRDLYYRLNVVSVTLPALRERRPDIPLLAQHFLEKFARRCKRSVRGLSPEALACLNSYSWPGNVRELENAIERAVVLGCSDWILPEDLPETILEGQASGATPTRYHDAVLALKRELIAKAVEQANGNYTEAARLLALHPNYLHRLIRNMDLKSRLRSAG